MHADKWYHLSTDPYSSYARPRRVPLEELVLLAKSGPFGACGCANAKPFGG